MAGWRRPSAARICLGFVVAAVALSAGAGSVHAASPIGISARVGYHNAVKLSQWMPVSIDITNSGSNFDGTLELQASAGGFAAKGLPPSGLALYRMPISLSTGTTKHVRTYVLQDQPATITVRVVEGGRVVSSYDATSPGTTSGLLMGILSDQASTLDGLAAVHAAGFTAGVVHLTPDEISDSAVVLRAFDLLAIDDFATDSLTAGQRAALTDYVMNGGTLLLGAGGSWRKTLAGLPPAIVPMQITGTTTLASVNGLRGLAGLEVATGSPAPGATAWLSDGSQPLLIEKSIGAGLVSMATFEWNQDAIATWTGTPALLRQVYVRSTFGQGTYPTYGKGGYAASVAQKGGSLSSTLANVPSLDLPAWWLIGSLVLLYVLVVGPINYFVLRTLNRRALAWVTIPAIAIVASGGAYGASVVTKGQSVVANEISIVHAAEGWDRAYEDAYTGVLTPTRGDFDVAVGTGRPLISPLAYYGGPYPGNNTGLINVNTTTEVVTLPGMTAFTLRGFATESVTSAPHLIGSVRLVGGKLVGTVVNSSSTTYTDGVVIAGNSYQRFGQLAPGATVSFELMPSLANPYMGPPAYLQVYPNSMYMGGPQGPSRPTDAERENQIKTQILSMITVGGYTSSRPTVVAWSKQPLQDITVNGHHPRIYAETAVVMTMSVVNVSGKVPAGVISGRVIDVDGESQPSGPPGNLIMQKGSVIYDFMPTLAPDMHLTNASISSSNQFAKGVVVGPNGTPTANVKGQVWDWSQSAWVAVSYQDTGTTTVPDAAVNPSTGEVRMKVTSEGAFASGWLSLTGEVG